MPLLRGIATSVCPDRPSSSRRRREILLLLGSVALPVIFFDVAVLVRQTVRRRGFTRRVVRRSSGVVTKLLGLGLPLASRRHWALKTSGLFYDRSTACAACRAFDRAAGLLAIVDGQMKEPHDAYWQLGRLVLGRPADVRGRDAANHFRSWLVKAYFIPLMVVWMQRRNLPAVRTTAPWTNLQHTSTPTWGRPPLLHVRLHPVVPRPRHARAAGRSPSMFWPDGAGYQPFGSLLERSSSAIGDRRSVARRGRRWPSAGTWPLISPSHLFAR